MHNIYKLSLLFLAPLLNAESCTSASKYNKTVKETIQKKPGLPPQETIQTIPVHNLATPDPSSIANPKPIGTHAVAKPSPEEIEDHLNELPPKGGSTKRLPLTKLAITGIDHEPPIAKQKSVGVDRRHNGLHQNGRSIPGAPSESTSKSHHLTDSQNTTSEKKKKYPQKPGAIQWANKKIRALLSPQKSTGTPEKDSPSKNKKKDCAR